MKIQCNACETAEAKVLCCADEAALCVDCDQKVHAANKLATKHQRVPLSTSSSQMPKCDICQETAGYFFCLEDRALLCRRCDVSVHTANHLVSAHQRFLVTGVRVGLEATKPTPSLSSGMKRSSEGENHPPTPKRVPTTEESSKNISAQVEDFSSSKLPSGGGSASGSISQWQLDDILELGDYNQNYGLMDPGSSKADSGKLGDPEWSPIMRAADMEVEVEVEGDECTGQSPNTFWAVPEIPSPPTSSGLHWPGPKSSSHCDAFVPDIVQNSKGRRHL